MPQVLPKVELLYHTEKPEEVIAVAAKLCYSDSAIDEIKGGVETRDAGKFIGILSGMNHFSPFEHASFTFGIEGVSRSLLAQITRHRIASFSVKSQRYVSAGGEGFNYIVPPSITKLGDNYVQEYNRQMLVMQGFYNEWQKLLGGNTESSNEDARFVLPNAAETKMIVTMNARELLHFFSLRCCNRAQWEIREVAWQMLALAVKIAPNLFKNAGAGCIGGVCPEGKKCCSKMAEVRKRRENIC